MGSENLVFQIKSEEIVYKRFLSVWNRNVKFPTGDEFPWDIVGHMTNQPAYSITFPFHSKTSTVTLIQEYAQGPNKMLYTFPAGHWNRSKSTTIQASAEAELSEEARLRGGRWFRLIDEERDGIAELKWCRNLFVPFLVIDPEEDIQPATRDDEEYIIVHRQVNLATLKELILTGQVMLPAVQLTLMSIERLRNDGWDVTGWS